MHDKQLHEEIDSIEVQPVTIQPQRQKINLLNSNTHRFSNLLLLSIKIGCARILAFFIIIIFDQYFIVTLPPNGYSQSWNIMFYVLTSMMDFLGVLNDVQMVKHLEKDQIALIRIKQDLANKVQTRIETQIGCYTAYLSIYDIIKKYKYRSQSAISISETIRFLHVIITIYIFGNLAIAGQNAVEGQYFKIFFLWFFVLSIYVSVFELDFFIYQGSDGSFIERRQPKIMHKQMEQIQQSFEMKRVKHLYINSCRRPFQMCYIICILSMLSVIIIYFKTSLLNLMLVICICAHMTELIQEKHLQNRLMSLDLQKLPFKYLSGYKIVSQLTKDRKILYQAITTFTRISIILVIFAYFKEQNVQVIQSFILLFINILLFLSQYLKFNRLDSAKLYVLTPQKNAVHNGIKCSICLIHLDCRQKNLQLPCFSQHVFHYKCMKNWFAERKECPLCRYSLSIYELC